MVCLIEEALDGLIEDEEVDYIDEFYGYRRANHEQVCNQNEDVLQGRCTEEH